MDISTNTEAIDCLQEVVNRWGNDDQHKLSAIGKIIDQALSIIHTAKLERQMIATKEN